MTSAREAAAAAAAGSPPLPAAAEERRRGALERLPPPANSNKPLTPFSIADILGRPAGRGAPAAHGAPPPRLPDKAAAGPGATRHGGSAPSSPLCALEELASKTFKGLELNVLQAAEGREPLGALGPRQPCKKRRKSRTAFTNQQIYELEKRFLYQKYLSPADRDQLAQRLALSTAQVITWFQNRRAKLKRDLEEMRADVASLRALPPAALERLAALPEPPRSPGPPAAAAPPGPPPAAAELSEEEIDVAD
ncbi:transcription factor LBX2 [Dromaius novaehollandiae]|uniref:transcription factor LBX2 n=1 Tax=Dromaius novaehollandiae TaxID=8790 RepID=UPI00311F149C